LIAINGVESSVLSGNDTLVQTGDKVTIVPVVHGGT
jgi:molybdopterin converting factor small subunit